MIELFKMALVGQYGASLSMLGECVVQCPEDCWEGHDGGFAFWHVAYHTLFYNPPCFQRNLPVSLFRQ